MRDILGGLGVAFLLGFVVRILKLPIPAPPTLLGAGMVVAVTLGYMAPTGVRALFVRKPPMATPTPMEDAYKPEQAPSEPVHIRIHLPRDLRANEWARILEVPPKKERH